jgi:hypothetical protein
MKAIATIINGQIFGPEGQRLSEERPSETREVATRHRVLDVPNVGGVDLVVALLAHVVKITKDLSPADQRRARAFLATTASVLSATGYLQGDDQNIFQAALRSAVKGSH